MLKQLSIQAMNRVGIRLFFPSFQILWKNNRFRRFDSKRPRVIVGVDAVTNQVRHTVDGCLWDDGIDVDRWEFLSPLPLSINCFLESVVGLLIHVMSKKKIMMMLCNFDCEMGRTWTSFARLKVNCSEGNNNKLNLTNR